MYQFTITGTKNDRDEFQQLLKDARANKIDLIITKSISRFARNTLTMLETIRELNTLNIDVFFEEQNIHTLSGEGEMILTFLSTFAQEESRSTSENMKWRIKKDFEKGIIWGGGSGIGYKLENKKFYVVPEEAEIVRLIYELYLEGYGCDSICKMLESKSIKAYRGNRWNRSTIKKVLSNYNYTGDLILQKTYVDNHLSKIQKLNKGERNKYLIENNHEAIITKETFYKVQEIRKARASKIKPSSNINSSLFKGMIRCGVCGKAYTYKRSPYKEYWICSTKRIKGKDECDSCQVPDNKIKEAVNHILNTLEFDERLFIEKVDMVYSMLNNRLVLKLKNGKEIDYIWKHDSRKNSWTDEMKEKARITTINRYKGGDK